MSRSQDPDRGAVLVEAALSLPVVLVLLVGLVQTALGWHDDLVVRDAVESAARTAALQPTGQDSAAGDGRSLAGAAGVAAAVRGSLAAMSPERISRVVVFAPTDSLLPLVDQVPSGCRTGTGPSVGDLCDVINLADPGVSCSSGGCWWERPPGSQQGAVAVLIRYRPQWSVPGLRRTSEVEVAASALLESGLVAHG